MPVSLLLLLAFYIAKTVVWLHWEDFFRSYTRPPKTACATNVPAFFKLDAVNKVKDNAYLPWPRAVLDLKY